MTSCVLLLANIANIVLQVLVGILMQPFRINLHCDSEASNSNFTTQNSRSASSLSRSKDNTEWAVAVDAADKGHSDRKGKWLSAFESVEPHLSPLTYEAGRELLKSDVGGGDDDNSWIWWCVRILLGTVGSSISTHEKTNSFWHH